MLKMIDLVVMRLVVMLVAVLVAANAHAVTFVDAITVDTAPVFALATIIVTALAGVWGIRKVIKLVNRS